MHEEDAEMRPRLLSRSEHCVDLMECRIVDPLTVVSDLDDEVVSFIFHL